MTFSWGIVIDRFTLNFDGDKCDIVKYHPWVVDGHTVLTGKPNRNLIAFHCDEISRSSDNIYDLFLHWLATKQLGYNNDSLVCGLSRALKLESINEN